MATAFWLFGQSLGGMNTGMATDPNAGSLVALLAVALFSASGATANSRPIRLVQPTKSTSLIADAIAA